VITKLSFFTHFTSEVQTIFPSSNLLNATKIALGARLPNGLHCLFSTFYHTRYCLCTGDHQATLIPVKGNTSIQAINVRHGLLYGQFIQDLWLQSIKGSFRQSFANCWVKKI